MRPGRIDGEAGEDGAAHAVDVEVDGLVVVLLSRPTSHSLKRPKPVVSGWVVSGYLSCPLRKHCGNADKQQFKHDV